MDFSAIRPRIIHWEDRHLHEQERKDCVQFLEQRGYTVFTERHPDDSTAYLPEVLAQI